MKTLLIASIFASMALAQQAVVRGDSAKIIQRGLASALPATCTVGDMYFATDGINGRNLQKCAATNTWSPLTYDQGTSNPGTCAVGQIFFRTDATAGQNLYYCTVTNTWVQQLGSVADTTLNTGTSKGWWAPFGLSNSVAGAIASGGTANRGYRIQITLPYQLEFASFNITIATAATSNCAGGSSPCGFQMGIYSFDLTTQLAGSSVAYGAATLGNINTAGSVKLPVSSGTLLSGGKVVLPKGVYWLIYSTDSTTLALNSLNDTGSACLLDASTTTAATPSGGPQLMALSSSALSTGNGSSLALSSNLSSATWVQPSCVSIFPRMALVN